MRQSIVCIRQQNDTGDVAWLIQVGTAKDEDDTGAAVTMARSRKERHHGRIQGEERQKKECEGEIVAKFQCCCKIS
jgi:hypothetical protein